MNKELAFEPAVVGGIEVKNRIFRSATQEIMPIDGKPSPRMFKMYEDLCEGEVGLIITGASAFSNLDHYPGQITDMKSGHIAELKKLTDSVHQYGTKIVAQIYYAAAQLFFNPEAPVYGPSEYVDPVSGLTATALTKEQISLLVKEFGQAAFVAKEAGFDGVQLHGAHGYVFDKFLDPTYNTRTDEYGGDFENRIRFLTEVIEEIKSRCGKDYPLWIKLTCSDFLPENKGITVEDFLAVGVAISKKGIDAIEVSGGSMTGTYSPLRSKKHAAFHLEEAKRLTEKVDASVIAVGGFREIDVVESALAETKIDAVSIGRALVREPKLIKRWMNGDRSKATCIACNGCFNPNGVQCFFDLTKEEQEKQRPMMEMMRAKD
ncbi:hypothetical protein BZG02_13450 [Labilibaculum filiforme]|uniref:NADH:flavin oxidoreductase/NADH oxidase N-terminal domain-containing protein n=1 Tax=Labilibaculum filiforme TaxID=1940526 RepID=A0A2N3HW64_9BACT|nr:NADH:flavin oxidoreductase [Labilibaculum filiforme]PKQ62310.1 hypothetical protein BZG02_13450 [Labilibaculum filiforme]